MKFQEIIGQEAAIRKVKDAIQDDRVPHAWLLTGPAGIGKLALAHAIAAYVNCQNQGELESCGKCANCLRIKKGVHPDIHYLLPIIAKKEKGKQLMTDDYLPQFREAWTQNAYLSLEDWQQLLEGENKQLGISVHEIRNLKKKVYLKAFEAPFKVVILWYAERINNQGANAFLKLLEEPPEKTLLLMTCDEPTALLKTILSRCQQLPMGRISTPLLQTYLEEEKQIEKEQAAEIAAIAEGSIGQALSLMGEAHQQNSQTFIAWMRTVYTGNMVKISEVIKPVSKASKENQKLFLALAIKKFRNALLFHVGMEEIALLGPGERQFQENFAKVLDAEKIEAIIEELESSLFQISRNVNADMVWVGLSINLFRIIRHKILPTQP
ncbi:MAG: DNA polymerase III subunit delta' [Bacteroidota bacterium]